MVIDSACALSYGDGNIIVRKDGEYRVPISQVRNILVNTNSVTVSAALLNALSKNNVHSVFCDDRHNPSFELAPFSNHTEFAGKPMDQCMWNEERKLLVWQHIVISKIKNQRMLLKKLNIDSCKSLLEYEQSVLLGDENNCEAQAARIYFRALFGSGFVRHSLDEINSALNYGYILLLNSFNRILSLHGYNTALGIKHCSRHNRFNLSCDLMEPFRPFVDRTVHDNAERELDWEYKKLLIESMQKPVRYGGREMKLTDACELYSLDVLKSISGEEYIVKEICLD